MFELYSQRNLCNDDTHIYTYDNFNSAFRNQLFFCLEAVYNNCKTVINIDLFNDLHNQFSREKGLKELSNGQTTYEKIEHFIDLSNYHDLIDFIDYSFNYLDKQLRIMINLRKIVDNKSVSARGITNLDVLKNVETKKWQYNQLEDLINYSIDELNKRFEQHYIGYEFINSQIIRKDNKYMHSEVVKPALIILKDQSFKGAEQEFLKAHDYKLKGDNKSAIQEALKAFESTLKTICDLNNYNYNPYKDTSKDLITILINNSFFPSYLSSHISGLRTTLESGLPTLRNKQSGHGQGINIVKVSDEFVEYALNLAATNIILLCKIQNTRKPI